ncbi:hypothetical protein SDC9_112003 [bioreactor metagenome]|uniref:Uncharacterized protein n=1 Tax=bioreactor metagenome TaxID=1076179 RepID=A0A645BKQ4_9ZZZZ
MDAVNPAVGRDFHDILGTERAFVDAARGNPDVAFIVLDGKIAAGGGGHAVIIQVAQRRNQNVSGVGVHQ